MSPIEAYMAELEAALRARGGARRRFLLECREHLADAAAERGEGEAVRAFGPASEIATAFDVEVAARRGVRATFATVAGVLATGGSTLALIHAAAPGDTTAPALWAVAFFVGAQVAGVAAALAVLQTWVSRRSEMPPADVLLLSRRNGCALVAAGVTMFAAGAAVPGQGSAALLLAGPVLVCIAFIAVIRARSLARRLDASGTLAVHPPLEDLGRLLSRAVPLRDGAQLLALTTALAAAGAFARDRAEHATASGALLTAGIEGAAVVVCFMVLGRALGLIAPARAVSCGYARGCSRRSRCRGRLPR
jgi:hypothetical protein